MTDEPVAIRPNFGKRTFMIRFGKCFWTWELNNPPQISGNVEVQRAVLRRAVVGHPKVKLTASKGEVDESNGVYLVDNTLNDFLRSKRAAQIYMRYVFLPFCAENSLPTCKEYVRDPRVLDDKFGPSIVSDTEKFVQKTIKMKQPQPRTSHTVALPPLHAPLLNPTDALFEEARRAHEYFVAANALIVTRTYVE